MADIEIEKQRLQNRKNSGQSPDQPGGLSSGGGSANPPTSPHTSANEDDDIEQLLERELANMNSGSHSDTGGMEEVRPSSSLGTHTTGDATAENANLQQAAELINEGFKDFTDQYARASQEMGRAMGETIGDKIGSLSNSLNKIFTSAAATIDQLRQQGRETEARDAALTAIDRGREQTNNTLGASTQKWFQHYDRILSQTNRQPSANKKEAIKKVAIEAVDFIPFVGSAKMLTEAARGKTFQGTQLTNKQRAIHALEGGVYLLLDSATLGTGGAAAKGGLRASKLLTRNAALARKIGLSRRLYKPVYKAGRAIAKNERIEGALTRGLRKIESKRKRFNIDIENTEKIISERDSSLDQTLTAGATPSSQTTRSIPVERLDPAAPTVTTSKTQPATQTPTATQPDSLPQQEPAQINQLDQAPNSGMVPTPINATPTQPKLSQAEQEQQWQSELQRAQRGPQSNRTGLGKTALGRPVTIPSGVGRSRTQSATDDDDAGPTEEQEQEWGNQLRTDRLNQLRGPMREQRLKEIIKMHTGDLSAANLDPDTKKLAKILETESGTDERRQAIREALKVSKLYKSSFLTSTGGFGYALALGVALAKDLGDGFLDFIDAGTVTTWITTTVISVIMWIIIHKGWLQKLLYRFRFIARAKYAIKKAIARRIWMWLTMPIIELLPFLNVFPSMTFTVWFFKRGVDRALADAEREIDELEKQIRNSL